jgi:hypothetical protein
VSLVKISVPFENLEPGMELAEPVLNRLGQILLSKGSTITPRHITVIKTSGIRAVVIKNGEADITDPMVDKNYQKGAVARIKKRLLWDPHSPLEEEIIYLAIQQVVQRSLQGSP